jgi:CheY-like chemotaxis protein
MAAACRAGSRRRQPYDLRGITINTSENDIGHGLRILLVDDNEDASSSMAELLTLCGHDVRIAGDGVKALETAAQFVPQLVLSDIGLPGMDGYQLAPALRRLAGSRPMVLAALTGYGQPMDRERALTAGFDHHLTKPLQAEILLRFVDAQAAFT